MTKKKKKDEKNNKYISCYIFYNTKPRNSYLYSMNEKKVLLKYITFLINILNFTVITY